MFFASIIVVLIIMDTVFGEGIALSLFGFVAEAEPGHLQEELRTFLIAGAHAPGDYEAGIKLATKIEIELRGNGYEYLEIRPLSGIHRAPPAMAFAPGDCSVERTKIETGAIGLLHVKRSDMPCRLSIGLR